MTILSLQRLRMDVFGVAKQSSKGSKVSYLLYLAIQEE